MVTVAHGIVDVTSRGQQRRLCQQAPETPNRAQQPLDRGLVVSRTIQPFTCAVTPFQCPQGPMPPRGGRAGHATAKVLRTTIRERRRAVWDRYEIHVMEAVRHSIFYVGDKVPGLAKVEGLCQGFTAASGFGF